MSIIQSHASVTPSCIDLSCTGKGGLCILSHASVTPSCIDLSCAGKGGLCIHMGSGRMMICFMVLAILEPMVTPPLMHFVIPIIVSDSVQYS